MPTFTREDNIKMQIATNIKNVIAAIPTMLNRTDIVEVKVAVNLQTEEMSYTLLRADGTEIE